MRARANGSDAAVRMGNAKIAVELKTSVDSNGRSMISAKAAPYGQKRTRAPIASRVRGTRPALDNSRRYRSSRNIPGKRIT